MEGMRRAMVKILPLVVDNGRDRCMISWHRGCKQVCLFLTAHL